MGTIESAGNNANIRARLIPETQAEEDYLASCLSDERLTKIKKILLHRRNDLIPVMYSLYDSYNIAGILRTSEALGLQEIKIIDEVRHNSCPKCVTKGCEKWLSIDHYRTYEECAANLRQRGYRLLVADMDGIPLDKIDIPEKVALVVGSEHDGVPSKIRHDADTIVSIPMCGFSQSMNVSVSMAVLLSSILSKRGFSAPQPLAEGERQIIWRQWLMKAVPHAEELLARYRLK